MKILKVLIFIQIFWSSHGLNFIPRIRVKPLIRAATEIATDLVDYTLTEILNFNTFKNLFHKHYDSEELENKALLNFLFNQRSINKHNEKYEKGLVSFTQSPSEYSDMTSDEVNLLVNGFIPPNLHENFLNYDEEEEEDYDYHRRRKRQIKKDPEYLNYVEEGYLNFIQDQGVCGSCWSFSAIATLEAACYKKTKKLLKLSEQNLIDCNRDDVNGNFGCSGGDMLTAFKYIKDNSGIGLASHYPYEVNDTFECRSNKPRARVKNFAQIQSGNEELLKKYLIKYGPIAIAIDASLPSFQNYRSGIYYDPACSNNINHAMVLVGYGTSTITNAKTKKKTKQDYWLIRNTYGELWGEDGYMRLARNRDNHCGITDFAVVVKCQ